MALSPASTRSMKMTWRKALKASGEKSSLMRHPCTYRTWPPPLRSLWKIETEERLGHTVVVQSDITAEVSCQRGPAWYDVCSKDLRRPQPAILSRLSGLQDASHAVRQDRAMPTAAPW